jgi:hypothetical protein
MAMPRSLSRRSPRVCQRFDGWRALSLVVVVATVTMCGDPSKSRRAADRFLDLYYVQDQVAEAAQLCTGDAKARLDTEMQIMRGVPRPAAGERPVPTIRRQREEIRSAGHASYVYRVQLASPSATRLFARLDMIEEGGRWLVAKLDEKERPTTRP